MRKWKACYSCRKIPVLLLKAPKINKQGDAKLFEKIEFFDLCLTCFEEQGWVQRGTQAMSKTKEIALEFAYNSLDAYDGEFLSKLEKAFIAAEIRGMRRAAEIVDSLRYDKYTRLENETLINASGFIRHAADKLERGEV